MRQLETQLKMKQNELEIQKNQNQMLSDKLETQRKKIDSLNNEITELTHRAEKAEKEKQAIELESKSPMLESDHKQDNVDFEELLSLCRTSLEDNLKAIKIGVKSNDDAEEQLRNEILEASKNLNVMKTDIETQKFEFLKKQEDDISKFEAEKYAIKKRFKEELDDKTASLMKFKNIESKYKAEKEKSDSYVKQLKELQDQNNNLKLDLNVMKQQSHLKNDSKVNYS